MSKKLLAPKIAMVSGATSGIGKATATLLAKKGYHVIITGRRLELLKVLQEKLERKYGAKIVNLCFDIRSFEETQQAINSLPSEWKNIDILVNNAGLAKGLDPIDKGSLEHWEIMIDTNIKGLLYITRLISPITVERGTGHIINVCSTAGHETYPMGNVYAATKHAVDALTKGMRLDLYTYGIRVSQVSPGHVEETEFALNRFDGDTNRSKIYENFNPLTSKDVAETIMFIAGRPIHINIQDVLMMGTQQANSTNVDRTGRKYDFPQTDPKKK